MRRPALREPTGFRTRSRNLVRNPGWPHGAIRQLFELRTVWHGPRVNLEQDNGPLATRASQPHLDYSPSGVFATLDALGNANPMIGIARQFEALPALDLGFDFADQLDVSYVVLGHFFVPADHVRGQGMPPNMKHLA